MRFNLLLLFLSGCSGSALHADFLCLQGIVGFSSCRAGASQGDFSRGAQASAAVARGLGGLQLVGSRVLTHSCGTWA